MDKNLWKVEYDVNGSMRHTRERRVVTKSDSIAEVEKTLIDGFSENERKQYEFIRQVTFIGEVFSD